MTTHEAFEDSADQDLTAQSVQSNVRSTLSTFCILDYNKMVSSSRNGIIFLANEKARFIFSVVKELMYIVKNHMGRHFLL